jgi:hypothetical protein
MKMFVYGPNKFFVAKEGTAFLHDPSYRLIEGGRTAVHLTWLVRGFEHSASYHQSIDAMQALDWCQEHCGRDFLMHQDRNVLFMDAGLATMFKLAMYG